MSVGGKSGGLCCSRGVLIPGGGQGLERGGQHVRGQGTVTARGEGRGRPLGTEQGYQAGDGPAEWGQSWLPAELCGTNTCGCSAPGGLGGCRAQPRIGLRHLQGDPGKRGER